MYVFGLPRVFPGAGFGRQAQHAVSGTGRQQLPLLQSLWQLSPLLLVSHGGDGWTQGQHAEEKTVSRIGIHVRSMNSPYFFCFLICFPHCSYVLLELVETERDYVRDLGLVVEVSWTLTALLPKRADMNVSWFSLSFLSYQTNIFV